MPLTSLRIWLSDPAAGVLLHCRGQEKAAQDETVFETPLRLTPTGRDPKLSDMPQSPAPSKRRLFTAVILGAAVVVALLVGGTVWVGGQLADQLGAPGIPRATGSGPCGSADAVNVELVYAAQSVRACTRRQPDCKNPNPSSFTFDNQLRSSSRRYILFIQFDAVFPADMPQQTVQLDPAALLRPKGPGQSAPLDHAGPPHAIIQVTPRDPTEGGYTADSGTIVLSSTHGIFTGGIDATFSIGSRPDRPQPSTQPSPVKIAGSFTCSAQ